MPLSYTGFPLTSTHRSDLTPDRRRAKNERSIRWLAVAFPFVNLVTFRARPYYIPEQPEGENVRSVGWGRDHRGGRAGHRACVRGLRRVAFLAIALFASACGAAVNYIDPSGPVYAENHTPASRIPDRSRTEGAVRVVSFNVAYGIHIDRALQVLRESEDLRDFDVLMLQEMDEPGVEQIARELGVSYVYIPSGIHPKHDRDFGCAILSPWSLEEPRKIVLPHAARGTGLRRAVVVATVIRGAQRVRCYSLHLSSPLGISGQSRSEQVRILIADAAASPDPVIIAGDFNAYEIGHEFAAAGFTWATRDTGPTVRRLLLQFRYDHVFARDPSSAPVVSTAGVVKDNRKASDHKAVWSVFEFPSHDAPAGPEGVR